MPNEEICIAMPKKTKLLIYLLIFSLVDMVIPVPMLGIILIYVILQKPSWFYETMQHIYKDH